MMPALPYWPSVIFRPETRKPELRSKCKGHAPKIECVLVYQRQNCKNGHGRGLEI
jgi:hypothetical protein